MMKIAKKIISAVFAAVLMMCTLGISVSAAKDSIYYTAAELPSGEEQSFTLKAFGTGSGEEIKRAYKVYLSKSGTLTVDINSNMRMGILSLYDDKGNLIECSEYDFDAGRGSVKINALTCIWNEFTENFECTVKYELPKGTYFIEFQCRLLYSTGETTLSATYGSDNNDSDPHNKQAVKMSCLTLEMEVGDTIRLGAVVEPADADVEWSSSKTKVATVSQSGKVKAKKEGTAIITAICGDQVLTIKIIVV